jgi:hypothetical protein
MAAQEFELDFDGYWQEHNFRGIPSKSGVYCVYGCSYNARTHSITVCKLIYIGEAGNACERIMDHEKKERWRKQVRQNDELCFSFAYTPQQYRKRIEAALIFKHKPPVNEEYKWSFPFDNTTLSLSGRTAYLAVHFTVTRTS